MSAPKPTDESRLAALRSQPRPKRALITGYGVVLDACVLANVTIRDFLLWSATLALFRPIWTRQILEELHRALLEIGLRPERSEYVVAQMCSAFPDAMATGHEPLIAAMPNAEKDRHVLAAAVRTGAQAVVTLNLRHFPPSQLRQFNVEACGPDDFLRDLLDVDRDRMIEVLTTISDRRRMPPRSAEELLAALERNECRGFANDLRSALQASYSDS